MSPRKKSKDSMDEDYDPAMAGLGFGGGVDEASRSEISDTVVLLVVVSSVENGLVHVTDSTPIEPRSGRRQRGLRSGERLVREDG